MVARVSLSLERLSCVGKLGDGYAEKHAESQRGAQCLPAKKPSMAPVVSVLAALAFGAVFGFTAAKLLR